MLDSNGLVITEGDISKLGEEGLGGEVSGTRAWMRLCCKAAKLSAHTEFGHMTQVGRFCACGGGMHLWHPYPHLHPHPHLTLTQMDLPPCGLLYASIAHNPLQCVSMCSSTGTCWMSSHSAFQGRLRPCVRACA